MIKRIKLLLTFFFIITSVIASASITKIDSLLNILENNDGIKRMDILHQITDEYMNSSYEDAIKYANELLSLAEEKEHLKYIDLASSYLGEAYFYLDEIEKSIEFFELFLEINKKQNDIDGIGSAYNNLGIVYRYIEKHETAIQYYLESLSIKEKLKDSAGISSTQNNIGVLYFHMQNYNKALDFYTRSYELEEKLNNKSGIATSLLNIGEIHSYLNNYNEALSCFNRSINICEKIDDKNTLEGNYKCLFEMYKRKIDFQKALYYNELYTKLRNDRLNQETKNEIAELEVQYETKKKEKEIELLNKENKLGKTIIIILVISSLAFIFLLILLYKQGSAKMKALDLLSVRNNKITEQSKTLEKLNNTKDKFFSLISHDLKGAIGGFLSQTDFLAEDFNCLSPEDTHELIIRLKQSSKQLYELLENLLEWSQTQTKSIKINPEKFNLKILVDSILSMYKELLDDKIIVSIVKIEPDINVFADLNMISTVFRNLIANAIKFSYPNSTFTIKAIFSNNLIQVEISDEGAGISKKDRQKLFKIDQSFSNPGTNSESGSGLGLIICKEFIEMNQGKIWIESNNTNQTKGSSFKFTLKPAKTLTNK
ncbi:MAG: tetratricopeptide repeat protein [Bacteroidales bacterium]|nr:tetratricopeptide repeat protein [Bacteroidales bacterium]